MRVRILGALELNDGTAITAGRDRIVLAMLLLHAGRVVPVPQLVDAVWDDDPPATARGQLQTCVSRLRRLLTDAGLPDGALRTDPAGYQLDLQPGELDAELFRGLVRTAREAVAAGRPAEARRDFRAALALWRGPALDGIPSRVVRGPARSLDEQRLVVTEECVDVELRLGRDRDLVSELTDLVEQHPYRERLRGQLMRALSATGRQAEALAVYRDGRRVSADELGIEPGAELQETHRRILAGELGPARASAGQPPTRALPRAISDFTGREDQLARLIKAVREATGSGPVVQLIDGMPGSGKTTLAVRAAAALGGDYPDGQLFIDLHGHSASSPVDAAAALHTLLGQIGVPAERIPAGIDQRVALWRSELADRRVLVLLDNAASTAQVSPLLAAGEGCLTLVTSRRRLAGLDGARPHSLGVLDPDEAIELLGRIAGPDRVAAESAAAAEVVRRCGYLPLAIRIAGARLAHRPQWQIADLVERLGSDGPVLTQFTVEQRSVGGAFKLSYGQLAPPVQRMFRLLGLHPGDQFDAYAGAALAGLSLPVARDLLGELVDAHLLDEVAADRYRFHDLIREFARSMAETTEPDSALAAPAEGLLNFYLSTAIAVARQVEYPSSAETLPDEPVLRPELVEPCAARGRAWFAAERTTLVAMVDWAAERGEHRYAWQLARAVWGLYYLGGHLDDLVRTHVRGLRAAEALGDERATATIRNYLGSAYFRLGRYRQAAELMRRVLDQVIPLHDRRRQVFAHLNLAALYAKLGQVRAAERENDLAVDLVHEGGGGTDELVQILNGRGYLYAVTGRYPEALKAFRTVLFLGRQVGSLKRVTYALGWIGAVRARAGDPRGGLPLMLVALRWARTRGDRFVEGEFLNEIAAAERAVGRLADSAARYRDGLAAMRHAGDLGWLCMLRNGLGGTLRAQGAVDDALAEHRRALSDATRIGLVFGEAQALDGIAACLRPTDPAAARAHWQRALVLYRQVEAPDQHEVEQRLAHPDRP